MSNYTQRCWVKSKSVLKGFIASDSESEIFLARFQTPCSPTRKSTPNTLETRKHDVT